MDVLLVLHVVFSLLGIASGFWVVAGWFNGKLWGFTTSFYLLTTLLTSLTGFLLPADQILPSHMVGLLSVIIMVFAINSLYVERLQGSWRNIYIATALTAFYLNVFVGVVQAFLKVDFLHALAPTQQELPFVVTQAAVFIIFTCVGIVLINRDRRYNPFDIRQ